MFKTDEWLTAISKDPALFRRELRLVVGFGLVGTSALAVVQIYWLQRWFGPWVGTALFVLGVGLELYLAFRYCQIGLTERGRLTGVNSISNH